MKKESFLILVDDEDQVLDSYNISDQNRTNMGSIRVVPLSYLKLAEEKLESQQAFIEKLMRIVEFYGNPDTWQNYGVDLVAGTPEFVPIDFDREDRSSVCGFRARTIMQSKQWEEYEE